MIELENAVFSTLITTGALVASGFFIGAVATIDNHSILYGTDSTA